MTLTLSQVTKGLFQANLFVQVTLIISPVTQTTLPLYKGTLSSDSLCCRDFHMLSIVSPYIKSLFFCDVKSPSLSYHATLSATHIHTYTCTQYAYTLIYVRQVPAAVDGAVISHKFLCDTHTQTYPCVRYQQQQTAQV